MAIGRVFADCTPTKGTGAHTLEVSVHIENGTPRLPNEVNEAPVYVQQSPAAVVSINSYCKYPL
jgi:hypothetical protein